MSRPNKTDFEIVPSLASILDRYDGFLIDQWGVMHNGIESMEHATECVHVMAKADKKMVIVSNSPGDEDGTLNALPKLGFNPQHFVGGAVTSGMLATDYIRENYNNNNNNKSPKSTSRAIFFGWVNPAAPSAEAFLERCGDNIELVDWNKVDKKKEEPFADVLILQGCEAILGGKSMDGKRSTTSLGDFVITGAMSTHIDPILKKCAHHNIPLLCVDPDFVCVNPDGTQFYMPGTIARRYEELWGGECVYFGKPHSACFREGLQRLVEQGVSPSRIAMIGDSLHHDVKGASKVGLDSILVLGGVHRKDLGHDFGSMAPRGDLQDLFENVAQTPTIVAPLLMI